MAEYILKDLQEIKITDSILEDLWYDWFCSDKALINRAKPLISIAKKITNETLKNTHVWLKNNCPMSGGLYDDIRFSNEDENLVVLSINSPHENGKYAVYSCVNDFKDPIILCNDKKELIEKINEYDFLIKE